MSAIRCIGGPLDGQLVADYGKTMSTHERIKLDFGEMIAFGAPSVAQTKTHIYRFMPFAHGRFADKAERYVHESVTDDQALERIKREWGVSS
jgi:hypothetical protein